MKYQLHVLNIDYKIRHFHNLQMNTKHTTDLM